MIDESAPRDLKRFIAKHNRQALVLTFFALLSATLLWGLLFLLACWFTTFVKTLTLSFNPNTLVEITNPNLLGPYFVPEFLVGACIYLIVAWVIRRNVNPDKVREARHYMFWLFLEIFMAVPNVTFSVWGNFSARVHLRRREMAEAWNLLLNVKDNEGRLSMTSLRTIIEDERTLGRVLVALQLAELIGVRESQDEGWFLYLQNLDSMPALKPDLIHDPLRNPKYYSTPDPTYQDVPDPTFHDVPDPTYQPMHEPADDTPSKEA